MYFIPFEHFRNALWEISRNQSSPFNFTVLTLLTVTHFFLPTFELNYTCFLILISSMPSVLPRRCAHQNWLFLFLTNFLTLMLFELVKLLKVLSSCAILKLLLFFFVFLDFVLHSKRAVSRLLLSFFSDFFQIVSSPLVLFSLSLNQFKSTFFFLL